MKERKDKLEGRTFNYLFVKQYIGNSRYLCKCLVCGKETIASSNRLKTGRKKSCGCIRWKLVGNSLKTHGDSFSRLYREFYGMHARCYGDYDATAKRIYKNRGITVCDAWYHNYPAFKEWAINNGYEDNLTIDRINNDLGYSPENCRWITQLEQASNKRNNIYITIDKETHSIAEWCRINNVSYTAAIKRINERGWDPIRAVTQQTRELKERQIEYNGITHNSVEWSKITGIKSGTIRQRLDNGWSIEDALTKPLKIKEKAR